MNCPTMITTIYRCPTSRRGSRIEAKDETGNRLLVAYDHGLSAADNHAAAAAALAEQTGTAHAEFVGGEGLGGGMWAWVPVTGAARVIGGTMLAAG